jgi:hypothetical protein
MHGPSKHNVKRRVLTLLLPTILFAGFLVFFHETKQAPQANLPSQIRVWHSNQQQVGDLGNMQDDFNLMGTLIPADGYKSLTYNLNQGDPVTLNIGQGAFGYKRLAKAGHFNADIPISTLLHGENKIVLMAVNNQDQKITQEVQVNRLDGDCTLPYHIEWSKVTNPQHVGQYVDGEWYLTDEGLRTKHTGYDRLFLIGNRNWKDYEVTLPVTVHHISKKTGHLHGGNGVGIVMRFTGHVVGGHRNFPDEQPKWGYQPFGAIGWLRWKEGWTWLAPELQFHRGDTDGHIDHGRFSLKRNKRYHLKLRCETNPDDAQGQGVTTYSFKIWPDEKKEPGNWTWQESQTSKFALRRGGPALVAHHVDVTFGDVLVIPLPLKAGNSPLVM